MFFTLSVKSYTSFRFGDIFRRGQPVEKTLQRRPWRAGHPSPPATARSSRLPIAARKAAPRRFLLANGITIETMVELVRAGLATATDEVTCPRDFGPPIT
jgi:hypothetical protein